MSTFVIVNDIHSRLIMSYRSYSMNTQRTAEVPLVPTGMYKQE